MAIKIGNTSAFWGDNPSASRELLEKIPDLDYLTLDYLSEVSMSIMAIQKEKNPSEGYAKDFLDVIASLVPFWEKGAKVKVISNAGGLNPLACAQACVSLLKAKHCKRKFLIGVISGDDVLSHLKDAPSEAFKNLDNHLPISLIKKDLVTANAYLGAMSITDALNSNADIVITGRVADPSLTVGPCVHHFKWPWEDYDRIANSTIAGHLIECGTQVTGGISTDWLEMTNPLNIGFPIAEIEENGNFVITKAPSTGGKVSVETVKEQLLYEIGDPSDYISPDVRVSFLNLSLKESGPNRVSISGAKGREPPYTLKVSATYRAGYKSEAYLTLFGHQAVRKAKRCADIIKDRLIQAKMLPEKFHFETLGAGACVPGIFSKDDLLIESVLRLSVLDKDQAKIEYFGKQIASLVTCGPPGVTGYTSGRPHIRPAFGYWPCLIDAEKVQTTQHLLEVPGCH